MQHEDDSKQESKPVTVVSAIEPGAEVEKKEAVVISIIPPEELRDASLEEIKLAFLPEMEHLLDDIARMIWVNFRSAAAGGR